MLTETPAALEARSTLDPTIRNFEMGVAGFRFADLFAPERLRDLDACFRDAVAANAPELAARFDAYRAAPNTLGALDASNLLIEVAPHLSAFVAKLFGITRERDALQTSMTASDPLWKLRRELLQRRVLKRFKPEEALAFELDALQVELATLRTVVDPHCPSADTDYELTVARTVAALLEVEAAHRTRKVTDEHRARVASWRAGLAGSPLAALATQDMDTPEDAEDAALIARLLERCERVVAALYHTVEGKRLTAGWTSFKQPRSTDYEHLVHLERPRADMPELLEGPHEHMLLRDGFALTDPRMGRRGVQAEVDYCLYCHDREKDSCSKGLRKKDGALQQNPLGVPLKGCPLEEKISEAHLLMKDGDPLGALAMITVDNPMCPGTGHRICNDCMKACVFQKQDPVDIPQIETGALTEVLRLPFGLELYGLLTRWNPLNAKRPYQKPYNGKNVLVVGLGPAGYTLAHHLLGEGFGVVAIDGLKIEPLDAELTGAKQWPPRAVHSWSEVYEPLDRRVLLGFGGVSEYGITVRWDKNFLTPIYLNLARQPHCRIYGGVRFGGTLTLEDAWALGVDHVAIAAGAGKPTLVDIENNLIPGIRQASDFLMGLQLTGAFREDMLASLQVELPAIVIGGGLTATDTATELAAYYPVQVEKTLARYETLVSRFGQRRVLSMFNVTEQFKLQRFLEHGREVRAERERAAKGGEKPNFLKLVKAWGGVTIAYRRSLADSPAYRLNHEEVQKMLEEGISFAENLSPVAAIPYESGYVSAMVFERQRMVGGKLVGTGDRVTLPARTVCVAAGTSPNIIYEREYPGTFVVDPKTKSFKPHKLVRDADGAAKLVPGAPGERGAFFTSYERDGRLVSFYGDNHPTYAGSVVKAMASAKDGYGYVVDAFAEELSRQGDAAANQGRWRQLVDALDDGVRARVVEVRRLTPTIVDVIVRAPFQARRFEPGQFYRLQNHEVDAATVDGTKLLMEGIALTGAWVDREAGLLSLITLEMGVSSRLCATLKPGQEVVVMGPTGTPTEIPTGESVLLAGGGLGNAVLFSIGKALRSRQNRVVYFAAYKKAADLFKREEVEHSADQVIWSVDEGETITPARPQDRTFRGNVVQAMLAYAQGQLGEPLIPLSKVERIIAIGSDRMMDAVGQARHAVLRPHLFPQHTAISSINSPMQCMMKEVCAQCLQRHKDPQSGEERFVFTCFNQDQHTDCVDFKNLRERLSQNSIQEKLANLYLDALLEQEPGVLLA